MASPIPQQTEYAISDISVQVADLPLEPAAATASAGRIIEQAGFPFRVVMQNPQINQQILEGTVYQMTYHQSFDPWKASVLVKSDGKTPTTLEFVESRSQ